MQNLTQEMDSHEWVCGLILTQRLVFMRGGGGKEGRLLSLSSQTPSPFLPDRLW